MRGPVGGRQSPPRRPALSDNERDIAAAAAAIVAWVRSTGLRPFLDALPAEHHESFLSRYQALIEVNYPPLVDGKRLLAFPRLFIVAQART